MNIEEIEIHSGTPDFAFTPLRRLEAKVEAVSNYAAAPTINDGNAKIREMASKLGANAVIKVNYRTGMSMTSFRSMTITGLAVKRAAEDRTCPVCAESIKAAAVKCRYCGAEVEPVLIEPTTKTEFDTDEPLRATNNSTVPYWIATGVVVILMLLAAIVGNS